MIVDAAIDLAIQGFRVFPTLDKVPLTKGDWRELAGEPWEHDWTNANGVGMVVPPGVVVVDVDVKKGDGYAELERDWPELIGTGTARVRTASGGYHLFFNGCDTEFLAQRGLSANVDTRVGGSGFVVGMGSPGYALVEGDLGRLAPAPRRLIERLRKPEVSAPRPVAEESLRGLALAAQYLLNNPPTDAPEDGRRFAIACKLRGYGLEQDTALRLMHSWNTESEHPRAPDQIEKAVTNAYKYADGGSELPPTFEEMFGLGEGDEEPAVITTSGDDIWTDMPALKVAVPGLLAHGDHYVDAAPPSSAKTYRSIDFGLSAAFGRKWCGTYDVTPVRPSVAFLAFEDWRGVRERIVTWCTAEEIGRADAKGKIHILHDMQAISYAADPIIKELTRVQPGVLVVSTFADAMEGLDTMSERDVRSCYVRFVREVRKACPGIVIYSEAHEGKGNRDVMASQALRASADLMTLSKLDPKTGVTSVTIAKSPKHFARPADDVILAVEKTEIMIFLDGESKRNLVYRKPSLRVTREAEENDATRARWEAIIRGHHEATREGVAFGTKSYVYQRSVSFAAEYGLKSANSVYHWVNRQETQDRERYMRYREKMCVRDEDSRQEWKLSLFPERPLNTHLNYILDGIEDDGDD